MVMSAEDRVKGQLVKNHSYRRGDFSDLGPDCNCLISRRSPPGSQLLPGHIMEHLLLLRQIG